MLNEKSRPISAVEGLGRAACMSILRAVLLTTALCSFGCCGASGGSADEKDHSSSSLLAAGAGAGAVCAGVGVAGFEEEDSDARAAKGSTAGPDDVEGGR